MVLFRVLFRIADPFFERLIAAWHDADPCLTVGNNKPYKISDETDYIIPVHGERRGVVHVEIEVRHNEIESKDSQWP